MVTKPFSFEGMRRKLVAEQYTELLKEKVDTLITIPNDRLREVVDKKTSIVDAFRVVDDVLRQGVQGISDLITVPGLINLDFADVKTIMREAGSSMMGIGIGTGENRAVEAARAAVMSPLLEVNITGARGILFNVTGGSDLGLFEVNEAAEVIKEAADPEANIIFGTVIDDRMRDEVKVTVIATGFDGTRKPKANKFGAEASAGIESSLDERSREILAEIERDRDQRQSLSEQLGTESPFARPSEREATEVRRRSASRSRSAPAASSSARPTARPTSTSRASSAARATGPMRPGRRARPAEGIRERSRPAPAACRRARSAMPAGRGPASTPPAAAERPLARSSASRRRHQPVEVRASRAGGRHRVLGENRVQEAEPKIAAVPEAEWHLVGRLQSNKGDGAARLRGHPLGRLASLLERLDGRPPRRAAGRGSCSRST